MDFFLREEQNVIIAHIFHQSNSCTHFGKCCWIFLSRLQDTQNGIVILQSEDLAGSTVTVSWSPLDLIPSSLRSSGMRDWEESDPRAVWDPACDGLMVPGPIPARSKCAVSNRGIWLECGYSQHCTVSWNQGPGDIRTVSTPFQKCSKSKWLLLYILYMCALLSL